MYKDDFILIELYKIDPGEKNKSNEAVGKLMLLELKILHDISSETFYDSKYVKPSTFVAVYPFCWNGPEIKKTFARKPISINFGVEQKPEKANWSK